MAKYKIARVSGALNSNAHRDLAIRSKTNDLIPEFYIEYLVL
jgi:hypothetical protein